MFIVIAEGVLLRTSLPDPLMRLDEFFQNAIRGFVLVRLGGGQLRSIVIL